MPRILLKKGFWSYFLLLGLLVVRGGYQFTTWLLLCNTLLWKIHDYVSENKKYVYFFEDWGEDRPLDTGPAVSCLILSMVLVVVMEKWWSNNWQGKVEVVAETRSPVPLFALRHTWHMSYCGFEIQPSLLSIKDGCKCSARDWRKIVYTW